MGYNMKKYIKTEGNRIIEVRPKMIEGFIEIEVADELKDIDILRSYIYSDGSLQQSQDLIDTQLLKQEMFAIQHWLFQNDWKVNKITLGEWEVTDPRFIEYKEQRAIKRARLDEIKNIIGV